VYVYRCETATGLPRLDASGVARWCLTYRIRHPRRRGHLHVRGDKTVIWYCLPVKQTYCQSGNNEHQLVSGSRHYNVCAVLHDVVFVQVPGRSGGNKPSVFSRNLVVTTAGVYFLRAVALFLSVRIEKLSACL